MKVRIWLALFSVYLIWGSTYLAIRFAIQSMPPFLMVAARFLIAGSALYIVMRLAGTPAPSRRHWLNTAVMGVLLLVGGNGLVAWAETRVLSGVTALMIGSTPLWLVVIDAVRPGGARPKWRTLAGVLIGLIGIIWLVNPADLWGSGQAVDLLGASALVLASMSWALGSIFGRERRDEMPAPLLATAMEMLAGGAGMLLVGSLTVEWNQLNLAAITARSLTGLIYLILFGSLLAYSAYTWLLRVAPTPLVSTYAYVNPLVAVFLGYIFASEPLSLRVLGATVIILSSVVLINTSRLNAPHAAEPTKPATMNLAIGGEEAPAERLAAVQTGPRMIGTECSEGVD